MKQLVVLSGKGGTGKTTITAALAKLAKDKAFADCDVDAPNLHLLLQSEKPLAKKDYYGFKKAVKYPELCTDCGLCEEHCRFEAIIDGVVDYYACEGCGVCEAVCPESDAKGNKAIRLEEVVSGYIFEGETYDGRFATAEMCIGSGASGKLVSEVRQTLLEGTDGEKLIIIDGSPGIGCPVIASLTGVDYVLLVAEPTLSGLHDLQRIVETAKFFRPRMFAVINKADLNNEMAEEIGKYCISEGIEVLAELPYEPLVASMLAEGKSILDLPETDFGTKLKEMWEHLADEL